MSRYDDLSEKARFYVQNWDEIDLAEMCASSDAVIDKLKAEIAELQTHARISSALGRIDDDAITRVIELADRWQHDPCRTDALAELRAAVLPRETPDA